MEPIAVDSPAFPCWNVGDTADNILQPEASTLTQPCHMTHHVNHVNHVIRI